jgi:hypothetical protein
MSKHGAAPNAIIIIIITKSFFLRSPSGRRRIVFAPPQSQLAKPVAAQVAAQRMNMAMGEKRRKVLDPPNTSAQNTNFGNADDLDPTQGVSMIRVFISELFGPGHFVGLRLKSEIRTRTRART